jgi:hypothetical protein
MAYRSTAISSFLRTVLTMSVIDLTFLPVAQLFHGVYSPPTPAAPALKPLNLSGSLTRCKSVQFYHHHLPVCAAESSKSGEWSYNSDS